MPVTWLSRMTTLLMEPPASDPVARIPSPIAPVTVNPLTCTQPDLIVIPARHGALPGAGRAELVAHDGARRRALNGGAVAADQLQGLGDDDVLGIGAGTDDDRAPGAAASTADWIVE